MKDFKLPKEFAEKWIAALRSGNYQQGIGALYRHGAYCCLGVACSINGVSNRRIEGANLIDRKFISYKTTLAVPKPLRGMMEGNSLVEYVASLNDESKTFPEIADWIETNVEFI